MAKDAGTLTQGQSEGQDVWGGMGKQQECLNAGRSGAVAAPGPGWLGTRQVVMVTNGLGLNARLHPAPDGKGRRHQPCAGPGLRPRAPRCRREGKGLLGLQYQRKSFSLFYFFHSLLANIVILYINTKCQNVSQLNGSSSSAKEQADKRQNCSLQR